MSVTFDHVREAASRIAGATQRTPCLVSETLSELTGARVAVKFENLQFTASFKERGALNKLLLLPAGQRARGVVAMSAGNHAQAVARHAGRLGIRATIVMPADTPAVKVEQTRRLGAEVLLHGGDLSAAADRAEGLAREHDLVFVHPYDDPAVIAGQGTVALEMLEDHPDLAALLVPVGGGGLAAGCAVAAHGLRPGLALYGIQTERFPSMQQALAGQPIVCGRDTVAEGIAVKRPGQLTREILRQHACQLLLVGEQELEEAVLLYLDVEKTVAEGAGAAALGALLRHRARFAGQKVGVVLSGGNIDGLVLASIIERGLARASRLVRLCVVLPDRPGALAEVSRVIADAGANVMEVSHERAFGRVPLREARVEFVLATRGAEHVEALCAALRAAGHATVLTDGRGAS